MKRDIKTLSIRGVEMKRVYISRSVTPKHILAYKVGVSR